MIDGMKRNIRVLVVHNQYKISGGEDTVVENEIQLLSDAGIEVFSYIRNNKELDECGLFGKISKLVFSFFSFKTYKDTRALIDENKISVVHVHNTLCLITPAVYLAALKMGVPVVQTVHNFRFVCAGATMFRNDQVCESCKYKRTSALRHCCYRKSLFQTLASVLTQKIYTNFGIYRSLNYIFLTQFSRAKSFEFDNGRRAIYDHEKTFVRPNFSFSRCSIVPKSSRKRRVVYAGRIDEQKGVDALIGLWEDDFGIDLFVCGAGPCLEKCLQLAENKCSVQIFGFVEHDELLALIGESEALIMPSLWYEGMPMIIVESFSAGTPVIGSNFGNVASMIEDGLNGYTFNPRSKVELLKCLKLVQSNNLVPSTTRIFEERFSSKKALASLLSIYDRCINE